MKQVVILSGKGGTGKTSLAAALIRLAGRCVSVDADVDAANLALLLPGTDREWTPFSAGRRARIDPGRCLGCQRCVDECPFVAIRSSDEHVPVIDPQACEGCGVCAQWCGADAIRFEPRVSGAWTVRSTTWGPLVHAELNVGEDNSGKLVSEVRNQAARIADAEGFDLILTDGPPGIACPVHAAIGGTDLVVAVTEPGVAATSDLVRLLDVAKWFSVPMAIVLNKADLYPPAAARLRTLAVERGVPVLAEIPFLPEVPRALAQGRSLVEIDELRDVLNACWAGIRNILDA